MTALDVREPVSAVVSAALVDADDRDLGRLRRGIDVDGQVVAADAVQLLRDRAAAAR